MAKHFKLVVFIPLKHLEKVRQAVCRAGAGKIGKKYDDCTFYTLGVGTFRPLKGAKPYIGKPGKITKVREARLETIVEQKKLKQVVAAMKKSHPYEEPAFDIYPLLDIKPEA
jgi:hypothetical protein